MNSFKKQPLIQTNLQTLIMSQQNENTPVYEINLTRLNKRYYTLRYNYFDALYRSKTQHSLNNIDLVKVKNKQPILSANQKLAHYRMNIFFQYKLKDEIKRKHTSDQKENSKTIEEKMSNLSNDEQQLPQIIHEMHQEKNHRRGENNETVTQYFSLSGDAERGRETRVDSNMLLKPQLSRSLKGSPVPSRTQSASIQ